MTIGTLGVWPPLSPAAHLRPRAESPPFPLEHPNCRLFARARHGLWQGVQALGLAPGDQVLVPAYHHGSEVEALRCAGLEPCFYDTGADLVPDAASLDSLQSPRLRALYLVHYLGFPQDAERWRVWCDERGLLLLEDAAQAWLASANGRPVGSLGDLAIFCLYKTFGVPDGAAMLVRAPAPGPDAQPRIGLAGLTRRHVLWAMQNSRSIAVLAGGAKPARYYDPLEDFALGDPGSPPTSSSARLLPQLDAARTAAARRAHYHVLLAELGDRVPVPFGEVPPGASPFALPLEDARKSELLARLEARGVGALDFWSAPHPSLPADGFVDAARRRERTVCLPVHQELAPSDLERIIDAVQPRAASRRVELRVERAESLEALREEWTLLAERTENVFATWEWAATWWHHFGGGRRLELMACRSPAGKLVGVLPLYLLEIGPWRILRFLGHGTADQLGPVCAAEDRPAVGRALRRVLADLAPDLLIAEQLPGDQGWTEMIGGHVLSSEGNPVLRFDGASWDEVLAARSSNLRQQVRRHERKLERQHGSRYRLCQTLEELPGDVETLFALHSARWSDDRSSFAAAHAAFHRDFAALALANGWLRLWFLEVQGRTIAAWYGFRFGGVESYYQAGRDPDWEGPPAGFVLLAHSIRAALEDGMCEYRFLRGEESFKYRFANGDPGLETVGVSRGPLAWTALTAGTSLPKTLISPFREWLIR